MRSEARESPRIIFEDRQILVIDKPSGWTVNEAETTKGQVTIQSWLTANFEFPPQSGVPRTLSGVKELRGGIVHRLDKETSGVLLVGKTRKAFDSLQQEFKARRVKKTYLALVHGDIAQKPEKIASPIGRLPWNRRRFGVIPGGRDAETVFKAEQKFSIDGRILSLVHVFPKTGRTHQIRVHLKHIGHPVFGDELYAGRKTARGDRKLCPRLFLHAESIEITHPETGLQVRFEALLAEELRLCLEGLEKMPQSK